ncbi:hypothetical protein [Ancylobacter sp. TS-1]|uniref:hypothetical protein n=1 Tax=Ancylobacter sp. TS-1 TaxID=1850374 RepID=UPI001265D2F8|nr:hypothetical protein [Ancylobacter sp. TS-1]QFR33905.1 hypothetical protein GBB76_12715 [Ancylobacter sp. TS-1]
MTTAFRRLKSSYEALGLAIDFLTREAPFDGYRAGFLAAAIKHQLASGCHIAAIRDEKLVGYAGWIRINRASGDAWVKGELAELTAVPQSLYDAVALTVVRAETRDVVTGLIRGCRRAEAGQQVFFKRDYSAGAGGERRSTVFNAG